MIVNRFNRGILIILIISFLCVIAGSIHFIHTQQVGIVNNTNQAIFLGLIFCLMIFLLVWKTFRWLNYLNEKKCFLFSLIIFLIMTGLFTAVSFSARVMQFADSTDVLDTAFYLSNHTEAAEDSPFIDFIGSFGNNYPVILLESFLIKCLRRLGFQDIGTVLTHFNVVVLMTAIVLTWLIVRETRGVRTAAKAAVVCMLNPYLYLIVNWTYSMTYSLPVMMGIVYIALRLKRIKKTSTGIFLAFIEGVLIGGGFLIRPTTVFPLIAALLVWFPRCFRKRISRKRVSQILCIVLAAVLVLLFVNVQVDRRFGNIKRNNLPLSFWLLMGSHANGVWNGSDFYTIRTIQDPSERSAYALNQTLKNYKAQGIDGTLSLWYRKLNVIWADGGFFYSDPAVSEGNSLSEYVLGNGTRNQLAKLYSQAFRLFMILVFLFAVSIALYKHRVPEIVLIMMITVFGGIVFHAFWETNSRYSIPFILPVLIACEQGISSLQEFSEKKVRLGQPHKKILGIILISVLFLACSILNSEFKEKTTLKMHLVYSTASTRVCAPIEPDDCTWLEQDFYGNQSFNTLFFKASLPAGKTNEECSGYELSILNNEKHVLYTTHLTPDLISGQGIEVPFESISGYQHYYIRLIKSEAEKAPILFYTYYTYGVDPYRGDLIINSKKRYSSDIMMDVYNTADTTIVSNTVRIITIILILLSGGFISFVPVSKKESVIDYTML